MIHSINTLSFNQRSKYPNRLLAIRLPLAVDADAAIPAVIVIAFKLPPALAQFQNE
jgi:hypothetical protein